MSGRLDDLAADEPAAKVWGRLYGYLSIEMTSAALTRRTGVSLYKLPARLFLGRRAGESQQSAYD